jgi:hypothetical protein
MKAKTLYFMRYYFLIFTLSMMTGLNAYTSKKLDFEKLPLLKPSELQSIPSIWQNRIGTSLAAPKYHFTNKPILLEGVKKTKDLGYELIKLFVPELKISHDGNALDYFYNSDWKLKQGMTLKEVISHEYFQKTFSSGLKVFALDCVHSWETFKHGDPTVTEKSIEDEMYEAVIYLLKKYKNQDVTFIIQNWEGDWMMRAAFDEWVTIGVPKNWREKSDLLTKWLMARQRGVDRARSEIKRSKCKVFHAVEVNKVFDAKKGVPTVASHILPKIKVDMVSWSAYDGIKYGHDDGSLMHEGIGYLKKQMSPSEHMKGKRIVYIGEIGLKENDHQANSMKKSKELWDTWMSVYMDHDVPFIFQWALYDNELLRHDPQFKPSKVYENEDMKGMWLIRADGTKSYTQKYFDMFMKKVKK